MNESSHVVIRYYMWQALSTTSGFVPSRYDVLKMMVSVNEYLEIFHNNCTVLSFGNLTRVWERTDTVSILKKCSRRDNDDSQVRFPVI